ncbi:hypothetical protein MRX96_015560 [Rhipicephalus microplus]
MPPRSLVKDKKEGLQQSITVAAFSENAKGNHFKARKQTHREVLRELLTSANLRARFIIPHWNKANDCCKDAGNKWSSAWIRTSLCIASLSGFQSYFDRVVATVKTCAFSFSPSRVVIDRTHLKGSS